MTPTNEWILPFQTLNLHDIPKVGGKNASLGEMIQHLDKLGIQVPPGFAVTADAYRQFLADNTLTQTIAEKLKDLNPEELPALKQASEAIRQLILQGKFSADCITAIQTAYETLCLNVNKSKTTKESNDAKKNSSTQSASPVAVAIRSSATAEDLPDASFAGQQETYLNIQGTDNVLTAVKKVFASLFTERAIAYRIHQGFDHTDVAISVGVQVMVRSDKASSGVIFTLDTESGFEEVVLITASYGLGELLVQGSVNPDEFYVYKPALRNNKLAIIRKQLGTKQHKMIYADSDYSQTDSQTNSPTLTSGLSSQPSVKTVPVPESEQKQFSLNDSELEILAKQALLIEQHYGRPMDIEWAKDGITNELYIVQARPETVKSRSKQPAYQFERFMLKKRGSVLVEGRSVGQRINQGIARVVRSVSEISSVQPGDILVTDMTDPDWEPVMKRAGAIVTNRGGRTCHAAIIARELGIPAVVGCATATECIQTGQEITVSCAEGDIGYVYDGLLGFDIKQIDLEKLPELPFKVMMTIANPERAFDFQRLPNAGVGLARLEFVINTMIGIHPKACLQFQNLNDSLKTKILEKISGYSSPTTFYVDKLAEGISTLAAAFWPKPVVVRLSDFKSNEYANLLGGSEFEPKEENPMLGFRGASRYISPAFKECFALECEALKKVRNQYGLTNVEIMIPFVRTVQEAKEVILLLEQQGLKRSVDGLRIIMMCEIPANALLAKEFLEHFDGFSIGSNDLTQLTLGLDRDSGLVAGLFDERDSAVKKLLQTAITACKEMNKSIGICGQGPSDYPDFARWLMENGITSVSLNPDSVISTWLELS